MLTLGNLSLSSNVAIVFAKGEKLRVRFMCSCGEDLATGQGQWGSQDLVFKRPTVVVVEELGDWRGKLSCKHLRFARALREERLTSELSNAVSPYPKLRTALNHAGVPKMEVPGGFNRALKYADEILVPDYSTTSGSSGWLVKNSEVGKYLRGLPPLKDSGEIGRIWVNFVGFVNTPDECSIRVCSEDPTGQEAPSYYDWPRGCYMSTNHQIFRVEFDKKSHRVKKIYNQTHGTEQGEVYYKVRPVGRSISVGQRLPRDCR